MSDWAKREVEIACKREAPDRKDGEWDYGCACYESALKAYQSLMEDGHSGYSFSFTRQILNRLMEGKPLTPIEDIPEVWNLVYEDTNGTKQYQCSRMSSLFKYVAPDGKVSFHDCERYYCLNAGENIPYSGGGASNILEEYFPITMPYNPPNGKYKITTLEFLTDRANGDFDTKAYIQITAPDGEIYEVNRYFGEVDGEWRELTRMEFDERVRLHHEREAKEAEKEKNENSEDEKKDIAHE